jgi:hypothetical protein
MPLTFIDPQFTLDTGFFHPSLELRDILTQLVGIRIYFSGDAANSRSGR